jgi:hypothetical protein
MAVTGTTIFQQHTNHKARTQVSGESLREFAVSVRQLTHQACLGLFEDFIQREAFDGLKDWEVNQHLPMGGKRSLSEALNETPNLEATNAAARQPIML